jgi:hypothetical protein
MKTRDTIKREAFQRLWLGKELDGLYETLEGGLGIVELHGADGILALLDNLVVLLEGEVLVGAKTIERLEARPAIA